MEKDILPIGRFGAWEGRGGYEQTSVWPIGFCV